MHIDERNMQLYTLGQFFRSIHLPPQPLKWGENG